MQLGKIFCIVPFLFLSCWFLATGSWLLFSIASLVLGVCFSLNNYRALNTEYFPQRPDERQPCVWEERWGERNFSQP